MDSAMNFLYMIFFIIGVVLLVLGLYIVSDTKSNIKDSIAANGTFEKLESGKYVIVFNTLDGKEVQSYSLYNNLIKGSENVSLFYKKEKPEDIKINSFISLWAVPTLTIIVGVFLILMTIIRSIIGYNEEQKL